MLCYSFFCIGLSRNGRGKVDWEGGAGFTIEIRTAGGANVFCWVSTFGIPCSLAVGSCLYITVIYHSIAWHGMFTSTVHPSHLSPKLVCTYKTRAAP